MVNTCYFLTSSFAPKPDHMWPHVVRVTDGWAKQVRGNLEGVQSPISYLPPRSLMQSVEPLRFVRGQSSRYDELGVAKLKFKTGPLWGMGGKILPRNCSDDDDGRSFTTHQSIS